MQLLFFFTRPRPSLVHVFKKKNALCEPRQQYNNHLLLLGHHNKLRGDVVVLLFKLCQPQKPPLAVCNPLIWQHFFFWLLLLLLLISVPHGRIMRSVLLLLPTEKANAFVFGQSLGNFCFNISTSPPSIYANLFWSHSSIHDGNCKGTCKNVTLQSATSFYVIHFKCMHCTVSWFERECTVLRSERRLALAGSWMQGGWGGKREVRIARRESGINKRWPPPIWS